MNIVWFKRDLRIFDHEPLSLAIATKEPFICLLIIEPKLWQEDDLSARQYQFYIDSVTELRTNLKQLNIDLCIKVGDSLDIFNYISSNYTIKTIFSHMETWNNWTYKRDTLIKKWCLSKLIKWSESQQFSVFRPLNNRDGWASKANLLMKRPLLDAKPTNFSNQLISDPIPSLQSIFTKNDISSLMQKGGRSEGLLLLHSFFSSRGSFYSKEMSSPNTAFKACSRLSPYIAFGCLSLKEIHAYTYNFKSTLAATHDSTKRIWSRTCSSFLSRLSWHCHFIQKLESDPLIEHKNFHSAYDELNYNSPTYCDYLDRWKHGQTGFPMIDACMRALRVWGWLNFRMRAMVMSFAAHHLFLHWKAPAIYLASQFVDYEPGIHYSQCQMQAGTTGINAIRIYNPIKQSVDHDPNGTFIKYWVHELKNCPLQYIHTPWEWESSQNKYIAPIIIENEARKYAASQLYALRKSVKFSAEAKTIIKKHASRKRQPKRNPRQLPLIDI